MQIWRPGTASGKTKHSTLHPIQRRSIATMLEQYPNAPPPSKPVDKYIIRTIRTFSEGPSSFGECFTRLGVDTGESDDALAASVLEASFSGEAGSDLVGAAASEGGVGGPRT